MLALFISILMTTCSANTNSQTSPVSFVVPDDTQFRKRVDFWIKVYTEISVVEGVLHDAQYPEIILERMDFRVEDRDYNIPSKVREKKVQNRIKDAKEFYKRLFLSLHKKQNNPENFTPAEKRVFELYKDIPEPNKFLQAAHHKRIRIQRGLKERFIQGLYYSGRYLPLMEKIFRERGIPVEITRLPFVESSFNLKARSKVGASGIWQFMRSTGKLYLKIDDTVDERNDPIRATEAAAMLLKQNYEALNSWPLAITAYNHGRKGLMRAVRKVGSESLTEIIANYRSRNFGFASSNFFSEFLAAVEVEHHASKYFSKVERDTPVAFSEFVMSDFVSMRDIATYTRIPLDTLMEMNPGLSDNVFHGKRYVPAGYVLRIPVDMRDLFIARYGEIPATKKFNRQKNIFFQITGQ